MTDTPTETERPLRADARRNRERIIKGARELFAEAGIDVQMDDIARRAGVGVGTVYRHFPTKDALMGELVRQKFRRFAVAAREALQRDGDPFGMLADLLRQNADELARDAGMQHVLLGIEEHIWADAQTEQDELGALTA
ncbi:MAG: TetR/AcrR family transcriptional regulator, partial [Solirubrobacteraceae bacterium]